MKEYIFLQLFFGLVTILSAVLFIRASTSHKKTLSIVLGLWIIVQGIISWQGFYLNNMTLPPRFALLIGPPLFTILFCAITKRGRRFMDQFNPTALVVMNTVRVPVEFTLLWLFVLGLVPEMMTFEGRNFDIISGATAPIIAWLMVRGKASRTLLILWNLVCLGLVLNVVIHGMLSAPTLFQQLSFEQPNIGVMLFPFTLLPGLIVPLVLFSHVALLIKLFRKPQVQ